HPRAIESDEQRCAGGQAHKADDPALAPPLGPDVADGGAGADDRTSWLVRLPRKRSRVQVRDCPLGVVLQCARAGAGEMRMRDDELVVLPDRAPRAAPPG